MKKLPLITLSLLAAALLLGVRLGQRRERRAVLGLRGVRRRLLLLREVLLLLQKKSK